jgi:iron(III) transport system substrate-binding protein
MSTRPTRAPNRPRRLRRSVAAGAVVVAVLGLAACGSSGGGTTSSTGGATTFTGLVAAAKKEGSINLYTPWSDQVTAAVGKAFKSAYGITVNTTHLTSSELDTRVLQEEKAGVHKDDVFVSGDPFVTQKDPGDILDLSQKKSVLPAMAAWPAAKVGKLAIQQSATPYYIAYNKKLLTGSNIPKDWSDLTSSKYKNKVLFFNPANSATIADLYLMIDKQTGLGTKYLSNLVANGAKPDASGPAGAQIVQAGEKEIYFPAVASQLVGLPDLALATPSYTTGGINSTSVLAKSPHPDAALLFLNWLLTKDGVVAFAGGASSGGTTLGQFTGIAGMQPLPTGFSEPDYAAGAAAQASLASVLGIHD